MLPGRLERILRGMRDNDEKSAEDAVLSVKAASPLSGALTAEACCVELASLVRK